MGMGPAGLGVLHTSGKAMVTPPLSLVTTDILLTPTLTPMALPRVRREGFRSGTGFRLGLDAAHFMKALGQGDVPAPQQQDLLRVRVNDDRVQPHLGLGVRGAR